MQVTSGQVLEFDALRQVVGRFVRSPLGQAALAAVQPIRDRARLEAILADTGQALDYLRQSYQPQPAIRGAAIRIRFESFPEAAPAVQLLRIEGACLEAKQIFELSGLLERASEARSILLAAGEKYPRLAAIAARSSDFRSLVKDLSGKILPDGTVADHASVALNRLRRDIERQQKLVQGSLERFLRAHREDGTLQEEFVTIRNDRFVVPVVAGQRRKIDGVIHGASGSGHTLFVEPLETIDLNNDLVRLREEEMREVYRILREMTDRLREHADGIAHAAEAMGELDLLFGKAEFALDFSCAIPRFSSDSDRRLLLREARHPLLEDVLRRQRKQIVPTSLELDRTRRTLLISGPNTGGKTVAMKTVGLLALMAHAGLPVPCEQAEFPLFDQVLADIGDNQSIQESLSTFSAHIATIRQTLESVTPDSLVLLDELGRATDPEEGGALGVAILDTFRTVGAFTLASTHLLALKIYGANTNGVVNGSMGFDEDTLEPTFVLRLGAPGKSAGLDIARRLGISAGLIDRARAAMSSSERDIARFLRELHQRLESVAALEARLNDRQAVLAAREQALEKEWARKMEAKFRELEQRSADLARAFEEQARRTIDEITQNVEQRKASEHALRKVAKTRREFQEQAHTLRETVLPGSTPVQPRIEEGARVRLKGIRQPARVRRKIADDLLEVDAGLMKMQVSIDDVEEVLESAEQASALPKNVSFQQGPRWDVSYREINIIGQHAEEACEQVDKFMDSAALAQVQRVRIVHGHGMGILRKAIADLLAHNPHVEKFYPASPNEGGTGATIVELKG